MKSFVSILSVVLSLTAFAEEPEEGPVLNPGQRFGIIYYHQESRSFELALDPDISPGPFTVSPEELVAVFPRLKLSVLLAAPKRLYDHGFEVPADRELKLLTPEEIAARTLLYAKEKSKN